MGHEYTAAAEPSPRLWSVLTKTLRDRLNAKTMLVDNAKFEAYLSRESAATRADIEFNDALAFIAMKEDHVYVLFWSRMSNEQILADLETAAASVTGVALKFEEL